MSGLKRIVSGEVAQSDAKKSALASALDKGMNSIVRAGEKIGLKKQVGR